MVHRNEISYIFAETNLINIMKQVLLKQVKQGEFFKLSNSETARVLVRGYYERSIKKFEAYFYDNVNDERFYKGSRLVWIGFTF